MDTIINSLQNESEQILDKAPTFIYALAVLLLFILLGRFLSSAVEKAIKKGELSDTYRLFFKKLIRWIFGLFGVLIALNILGLQYITTSILAGGGITAIILGFAFRDIGENILAGFFLAFSRPFSIGDLIKSEGLEGRVKGVELRYTHIRTADGCDIFIPSSQIFSKPLHNYTRDGLRRGSFTIGIDYSDDIQSAIEILEKTVSQIEEVLTDPAPRISISGFTANYVELQVTFWINTFDRSLPLAQVKTHIMENCRKELLSHKFTFSSNVSTSVELNKLMVQLDKE